MKDVLERLVVVLCARSLSTMEAEVSGSRSLRSARSTKKVGRQPRLHRETVSQKTKNKQTKKTQQQQ